MLLSADLTTLLGLALLTATVWAGAYRWTNRLLPFCLLSPVLRYSFALFTIPIRLQLSEWAGILLRWIGITVWVEGNSLIKNGVEMAVDPACMGLQLTGISVLAAIFFLIWQERIQTKALSWYWLVGYLLVIVLLTIFCNLFRIVLLVMFEALPNTWAHELLGLSCVVLYAWLPAWVLAQKLVSYVGTYEPAPARPVQVRFRSWIVGMGLLAIGLVTLLVAAQPHPTTPMEYKAVVAVIRNQYGNGCQIKALPNGFIQLAKPGLLIYVKPQSDWFSADHSPLACWRGSGYQLQHIHERSLDGHPVYSGELRKNGNVLYTTWWFTNGVVHTTSQLAMRSAMLRGDTHFALVNVTTSKQLFR